MIEHSGQVKLHVANTVTLKYIDPQVPIVIECDASGVGVGGVLLQNGQPVTFISQALTDTQKCYSNIECELLALVIVIEHLHHYVFGRQFTVHTGSCSFGQPLRQMSEQY